MKLNFSKYILVGSTLILFIACLIEITVELGIHTFEGFASHHGLLIFSRIGVCVLASAGNFPGLFI